MNTQYFVRIFRIVCLAKNVRVKSTRSGIVLFLESAQNEVNSNEFLESLYDPCRSKLRAGEQGTITSVDAYGTISVDWDCGLSLGLIYEDDVFRIIE